MKLTYYSNVKDGQLQKNVRLQIAEEVKHFEGKRVEVTIEKLKSTRSVQQNRLWWLYVSIISKEVGYSKEEMHEILKFKFLKREKVDEKTGEVFEYIGSTIKLNKTDFADMVNDLIRYAAETFNIVLPLPGEQSEMNYGEED
jgi:hypothetical protein